MKAVRVRLPLPESPCRYPVRQAPGALPPRTRSPAQYHSTMRSLECAEVNLQLSLYCSPPQYAPLFSSVQASKPRAMIIVRISAILASSLPQFPMEDSCQWLRIHMCLTSNRPSLSDEA